jgi:CRISPR-associated protein Cmr6
MIPPVYLAYDTKAVLGEGAVLCESRTLLADRFAPLLEPELRGSRWERLTTVPAFFHKQQAWRQWVLTGFGVTPDQVIFGKLQARLLLNTTGDLDANPSLCLDRLTGIPVIPGSALKACARRMALQEFDESPALEAKLDVLYYAALAFGWTEADWLTKADFIAFPDYEAKWARERSDFAARCEAAWYDVCHDVQRRLWSEAFPGVEFTLSNWRRLYPRSSGRVQFLPAYPWEPVAGDLELDLASPHHKRAYRRGLPREQVADTEEPQSSFFPAVAPEQIFVFVLLSKWGKGRRHDPNGAANSAAGGSGVFDHARRWLQRGLALLGLGARTNAGYGWFDTSEELQAALRGQLRQEQAALREAEAVQELAQRQATEAQAAAAREENLRDLSDAERLDYELAQLSEVQFWGKLQHFSKHLNKFEKPAMLRALQSDRLPIWEELKRRARKGGQWAQVEQAIRAATRQFKMDKMP